MCIGTLHLILAADWWARAPAYLALVLSVPGVWLGWKAYQRNRERDAREERERNSADLQWRLIPAWVQDMFSGPGELHVSNSGAPAENLRVRVQGYASGELSFNLPLVRPGTPVKCGALPNETMPPGGLHLYAQWTDGLGTHAETYWNLTHFEPAPS